MTTISSTDATATAHPGAPRRDPLHAVTQLLGGDRTAITDLLRSGRSLDDLARDRGVSSADLRTAIGKGLTADPGAGVRRRRCGR